jgi:penicillin-binding protein 1A
LERLEGYKKAEGNSGSSSATLVRAHDIDPSKLNGALVSLESATGNILALVGSVDYTQSSFNRASQGKRQPGSAFKPFIYQVAIDFGFSGATQLVDIAKTYEYRQNGKSVKWQPRNYEKNYTGVISLREALVHSRTLATINLVDDIGLAQLIEELRKFNIQDIPNNLSISLGTMSMSPLELAKFYTSFSNNGVQVKTNLLSTVEQDGKIIYEKSEHSQITSLPTQAYIMTTILKDVVDRGTGRRAAVKGIEIAGKTGTTNNNIDGWFVGYSPTIATVVWFGNDDNTPMYRRETGATVAGPAFAKYYEKILEFYPQIQREFEVPEGIRKMEIGGKKEIFSDISKPPRQLETQSTEEELLF